jgi:hypothetical protein
MAAEVVAEEDCIGRRQRGKREERRRESKCAKNAFIAEWCDAGERCDVLFFLFRLKAKLTNDVTKNTP